MDYKAFDHIDDARQYFGKDFNKAVQCKCCELYALPWDVDDSGEINPKTGLCSRCADVGY